MYVKKILNAWLVVSALCWFSCNDETPQTSPGSSSETEVPEQTKETKLVVYFKDGNQMKFPLNENPLISFVNGQLVIKTNGREEQYDLQTLLRFAYE